MSAERIANVIRRLTAKYPVTGKWGEKEFTGLKGFDTPLGLPMMEAGYEEERPEELHVMRDQFEDETPEHEDELTVDGDDFKIVKIDAFPTKTDPLFFKYTLIKQN